MSHEYTLVPLFITFSCALARNPGNIIGNINTIDIANKLPAIPGLGPKGNDTNGGTTTVMGDNYSPMVPGFPQNIFGVNKTGSDNSSGSDLNNGNFGSIPDIPNKLFPNKTGISEIPGYGFISSIPNIFGNNKTGSAGFPDFGSIIPGIFGNKNMTHSDSNETTTSETGHGCTDSGTGSNNGLPDINSFIPGMKKNKTCSNGGSSIGIPFVGYRPFPNLFNTNKNETSPSSGINIGSITDIPTNLFGTDKENKTVKKRHCSGGHGNGQDHEHDETRDKRQIASGLGSLGSLVPGGSNLASVGSALGSGGSGDATLVLGMFQVLVKPIKTPSINEVTDIIKNPQNILTQPQALLNGGKT